MAKCDKRYNIFLQIEEKFHKNLVETFKTKNELIDKVEIRARAFSALGQILSKKEMQFSHQKEIISIFDEVFSDVITSIYLAGCALDKPAQSVLRRVLELGVSIVYMWDLPHIYWGWKCHDCDLNFNDMLEHLTKPSYMTFIASINNSINKKELFDEKKARRLYRILSNTIHGKISTFESNLPERYTYSSSDLEAHLKNVLDVEEVLLDLWCVRFFEYTTELFIEIPSIKRV